MKISAPNMIGGAVLAMGLLLSGCAAEAGEPSTPATQSEGESSAPEETQPAAPVEQAASCEWELDQVTGDATAPSGRDGDLAAALVGSWQHTHYDSGGGFESMDDTDIRFVFPSTEQMIYCQHVPGITEHAERTASVELDGDNIALPSPAPGYTALAWGTDTMLWLNNFDDSTYLLVRR